MVRNYLKRLSDVSPDAPSTGAMGTATQATSMRTATAMDLAAHEAYLRRLVDEEGLGYRAVLSRLAAEKGVRATPQTVRSA